MPERSFILFDTEPLLLVLPFFSHISLCFSTDGKYHYELRTVKNWKFSFCWLDGSKHLAQFNYGSFSKVYKANTVTCPRHLSNVVFKGRRGLRSVRGGGHSSNEVIKMWDKADCIMHKMGTYVLAWILVGPQEIVPRVTTELMGLCMSSDSKGRNCDRSMQLAKLLPYVKTVLNQFTRYKKQNFCSSINLNLKHKHFSMRCTLLKTEKTRFIPEKARHYRCHFNNLKYSLRRGCYLKLKSRFFFSTFFMKPESRS